MRALPAHGALVTDPSDRAARIMRHHEFRVRAVIDALGKDAKTGWDIVPIVFGQVEGFHRYAALFEGLAHLVLAWHRGLVERLDTDGITRWRAA